MHRRLALVLALSACGEATSPQADPGAARSASASSSTQRPSATAAQTDTTSASAPSAAASGVPSLMSSASAAPVVAEVDLTKLPVLLGEDGKTLAQTEDKPSVESPAYKKRMQLVWDAIVANDASLAEQSFFPKPAYELVKDIEKPGADWKARLMKAFARNVGEYHKKLGDEPKALTFLGVDIDAKRVKWIEPRKEGNKIGYWRVTRNKLRYRDPSGTERSLELTSMISWRGEWFVVHLNGFK